VVLSGLAPGQQYYYRFGSSTGGWSDVFSFYTAPALGDAGSRLRVVAIGDMGNYKCLGLPQYNQCDDPAQQTTQGALSALPAELVVDVGDVSYAVGREWVWDQYLHATEPLAAQVPHMTAIGNHDTDWSRQSFRPWWGNYGTDSGGTSPLRRGCGGRC
jgi:phosphodiesterase/alkaline phosphatase D-like protein